MVEATQTSVILPTTGWNEVCEQLVGQLRPDDELLIVCDRKQESVVDRVDAAPDAVQLVVAGEPERCSGKANAIAAGMEAASHDRIVWTDDDFHHPPNWLEQLRTDYERHGPTSEVPVFLGEDILSKLLEPAYLVSATLTVSRGDIPWAGALIFDRDDIDERAFLADLRRTVSDDGLLMEHTAVTTVDRVRQVSIGGSVRETLENQARFTKIIWYHNRGGTIAQVIGAAAVTVACLLAPLAGVRARDARDGRPLRRLRRRPADVFSCLSACTGVDPTVRLWDGPSHLRLGWPTLPMVA